MPGKRSRPKPSNAHFGKPVQVQDGESYLVKSRKDGACLVYEVCCDCSLVHLVRCKPNKSGIRFTVWRDEDRTQTLRKRKRRKVK